MLNLTGTDAESEGSKSAVGRGVAVSTDDCGAGEGEALFRANNVDDSLPLVAQAKVGDTELLDIVLQGDALYP